MRKSKDNKIFIEKQLDKILNKQQNIVQISKFIGTTRKTVSKWLKEYKENGAISLKVHKPFNLYSQEYNENIINLYKKRQGATIERFGDVRVAGMWLSTIRYFKYVEKLSCSDEHIRKLLIKSNLLSHRMHRKTKRKIKQNIKNKLNKTKDIEQANELKEQLNILENHRVYHAKSGVAGFRVEADGCFDHWFGKEKHCLYFVVDSFTGVILNMWFEKEETNKGYYQLFKPFLFKYGKSVEVRTDLRNGLAYGTIANLIRSLGMQLSSSSEPTFKPNVERALEDAQSLLPMYFMDININSPEEAIAKKEEILLFMNNWLKREMPEDNLFVPLTNEEKDNYYMKYERHVINQVSHVSINNLLLAPFRNGKRVLMNKKVDVFSDGNKYFVKHNGERVNMRVIKDVIQPKEFIDFHKKIEFEKKKSKSYRKMINQKVILINKKISHLNKLGQDIRPLDIST